MADVITILVNFSHLGGEEIGKKGRGLKTSFEHWNLYDPGVQPILTVNYVFRIPTRYIS